MGKSRKKKKRKMKKGNSKYWDGKEIKRGLKKGVGRKESIIKIYFKKIFN